MSFSGRCSLSNTFTNRDANRVDKVFMLLEILFI